jgi:hypothetical protein
MSVRKSIATLISTAVIALVGFSVQPAHASLAPGNPIVTGGGGVFTYTYGTSLSGTEKVVPGDFLTISGIQGYIAGSAFSSPLFTPVVTTVAGVTSITWSDAGGKAGPSMFNFGFNSTANDLGVGTYSYQDHSTKGPILFGNGTVQVPMTPELATVVSFGLCALMVAGLMLFKRNRQPTFRGRAIEAFA